MQTLVKFFLLLFLTSVLFAKDGISFIFVNKDMDYREYTPSGEIVDSEKSNTLPGIEFRYILDQDLEFKVLLMNGETDYVGSYIGSSLPYGSVKSTTLNTIYDIGATYKKTIKLDYASLKFGAGIGYYAWLRELSSTQNELYSWFYITPVLGASKKLGDSFELGIDLRYKYALNPVMKENSIAEDFKLGGVNTFEVAIPLLYSLNSEVDLFIEYLYSQQKIKKSDLVQHNSEYYYEPDSTTHDNYLKFGFTINY